MAFLNAGCKRIAPVYKEGMVEQPIPLKDIPFSGNPLDRASVERKNPDWVAARLADPLARVLPLHELRPLVTLDHHLAWRRPADIRPHGPVLFLGLDRGRPRFAAAVGGDAPDGAGFAEPREVAALLPAGEAGILAQARSLVDWHHRHGFCAVCGAPTRVAEGGAMRECAGRAGAKGCGAQHFPRTDPVVIMLAVRGDQCLVGRQPRFPAGFYSALAGFVEVGETIEDAVRREVLEEAGIAVGAVTYLASQPWPWPSSLMIGCLAEALDETITLDQDELEDARWISRADVRRALAGDPKAPILLPPSVAIARHLLAYWAGLDAV